MHKLLPRSKGNVSDDLQKKEYNCSSPPFVLTPVAARSCGSASAAGRWGSLRHRRSFSGYLTGPPALTRSRDGCAKDPEDFRTFQRFRMLNSLAASTSLWTIHYLPREFIVDAAESGFCKESRPPASENPGGWLERWENSGGIPSLS